MASPTKRISPEGVPNPILAKVFTEDLHKSLEAVAKSREEATPEPTYSTDNFESHLQYQAELLRMHFTPLEAEKYRQGIPVSKYWECEVQLFGDIANELRGHPRKTEDWRNHAILLKRFLISLGVPEDQLEQRRRSISDQLYWQHELDCLKRASKRHEYELKKMWKQQHDQRQKRVGHRSVQTRQPRSNSLTQTADHISSRTRSKTADHVSSRTRSKIQPGGVAKRVSCNNNTRRR